MNMVSEPDGRSVGHPGPARYSVNEMSILPKNEVPAKADGLCGERRSQGTGGIFRLRKMEHCGLCFDELAMTSIIEGAVMGGRLPPLPTGCGGRGYGLPRAHAPSQ